MPIRTPADLALTFLAVNGRNCVRARIFARPPPSGDRCMPDFASAMSVHQTAWRQGHLNCGGRGRQNGREYDWILPKECWEEGLWQGIRGTGEDSLNQYLAC